MRKFSFLLLAAFALYAITGCSKVTPTEISIPDEAAMEKVYVPIAVSSGVGLRAATDYNTFYGPQVPIGNGNVRSWINITRDGKPLAIGTEMTPTALENLPDDPHDFAHATYILKLHQKAWAVTPFDHITINWNTEGHEPPGIYTLPHFDFHFYKISVADQLAIPPYDVAPAGFDNLPPSDYLPALYFNPGGGVPQMGAHWVDVTSPEFHGGQFTHTFIYGSYNGKVTFEEPMITLAVIKNTSYLEKEIRQPKKFDPTDTYYPTRYKIWKDDKHGRYYVALTDFVWR